MHLIVEQLKFLNCCKSFEKSYPTNLVISEEYPSLYDTAKIIGGVTLHSTNLKKNYLGYSFWAVVSFLQV